MFIWDFVADTVLGQIIDWLYGQIVGFLGDFFMQMGSMGAELFEMSWVQSVVLLFYYLAWALYVTGIVVAAFECQGKHTRYCPECNQRIPGSQPFYDCSSGTL